MIFCSSLESGVRVWDLREHLGDSGSFFILCLLVQLPALRAAGIFFSPQPYFLYLWRKHVAKMCSLCVANLVKALCHLDNSCFKLSSHVLSILWVHLLNPIRIFLLFKILFFLIETANLQREREISSVH